MDPSLELLAASGGDTVKIFDIKLEPDDPCVLSYSPSPSYFVNSVKWNHTNLVVASAGEDKKISLWRNNGQRMWTVPVSGTDCGDNIEESILAISFSKKGSRYICSGGSGQVVRIWDLQRKRCIKWLRGHTSTITGVMYNCKDEHLASISQSGDLILHNLASGTRAAELKDPNEQVLSVLDYSRISRHILVTAGDDGSIHLWDTTGRSPKVSWLNQHSAPTTGISFSPSNDKIIASVGLDKKLYTYDSGSRRPSAFVSNEAPFTSLAFRDDGWTLAAGTNNGRVVFYDIRGKLQPFTALQAYSSSEAVSSLCWQRSKPAIVNENTCTAETVLLGVAPEDSVLMPDPLPSVTSTSLSAFMAISGSLITSRSGPAEVPSGTSNSGSVSSTVNLSSMETPYKSHMWPGGTLMRLHAPHSKYNLKDDMDVFSPVVDVQPITPSLDKLWDVHDGAKKEHLFTDKNLSSLLFASSRRFGFADDGARDHPIFDWKSNSMSQQDDTRPCTSLGYMPSTSSKSEDASITPPESWGGEKISDKFSRLRRQPSRFGMEASGGLTTSSFCSGQSQSTMLRQTSISSLTSSDISYENMHAKDVYSNQETSVGFPEHFSSSMSAFLGSNGITGAGSLDSPKLSSLALSRRFSTLAERIGTTSAFSDGTSQLGASPKTKKTGDETREELLNTLLLRSDSFASVESGILPAMNGGTQQPHEALQPDPQQGSNFTLQLFQRALEETLDSFQKSIHGDMRNLHIEILRQFHMQEMEMTRVMSSILQNQAELMEEVKSLRKENQQLRQLL
ncbi:NEURAL PRECURSOR CELL EXPRESSED, DEVELOPMENTALLY DOWN-REGULATED GENE 1 [Hibiscus trionum]|uniref:NEURAL CELL EXPRESSED, DEVELOPMENTALLY DOWN-REGULATED GENE 1 n=1 Tax=Hibiscus trionum TaxID=183268 RepID=A0A9W7I6I8_HIBTR|nr:NEURAL PRECURSOR CELL EXPRESSED, DEVELOPMENTALLY DOWN-REGULATED GENE 1 [Hibiscus trionum]